MSEHEYELHIPTEQYGFILRKVTGTPEDAVTAYKEVADAWKGGAGLPTDKFNALVDEYLSTGTVVNGGDIWGDLNEKQMWFFNEIKKSNKRRNK